MGRKAMSGSSIKSMTIDDSGTNGTELARGHRHHQQDQLQQQTHEETGTEHHLDRRRKSDQDPAKNQSPTHTNGSHSQTSGTASPPTNCSVMTRSRVQREEEERRNAQVRLHELRQLYQHLKAKEDETEEEDNEDVLRRSTKGSGTASDENGSKSLISTAPNMPRCPSPPPGMNDAQLCLQKILWTHYHSLQTLHMEPEAFLSTKLTSQQLEVVLNPVVQAVDMMSAEHFGIRPPTADFAQNMGEIQYWKIWESETVDMGIFFMPPGSKIPLHNHPGMSVVSRVLYGSVDVKSYQMISEEEIDDLPKEEREKTKGNVVWAKQSREVKNVGVSTMWLDPQRHNFHSIEANCDIGCALLDVMIPPYNNTDRDCHHYQIVDKYLITDRSNVSRRKEIFRFLETIRGDELDVSGSSPRVTAPAPPLPSPMGAASAPSSSFSSASSLSSSVGPSSTGSG